MSFWSMSARKPTKPIPAWIHCPTCGERASGRPYACSVHGPYRVSIP